MRPFPSLLCLLFLFGACGNDPDRKAAPAENDMDAAREFIRSVLDGRFGEARAYLLADTVNEQYLANVERLYQRSDRAEKERYRSASINIHAVEPLDDSTTFVVFSNSYRNDRDSLLVRRVKNRWKVDLKYLYEHGGTR